MDLFKETEAHIQRAILDWGNARGILMQRINVIGTPYQKGGLTFYRPATNVGMADIHATVLVESIAVSVWLEVKGAKGKLTQNQIEFRDGISAYGGHYYVCRSVKDAEDALKEVEIITWEKINKATERKNGGTT